MARIRLPGGRQFAVTWGIPDDYGGMTTALLRRSRSFVRLAGTPVDVLTFDARPDVPGLERRLRDRGALVDGMRLLNLYDWLRDHPLPGGRLDLDEHPFTPVSSREAVIERRRGDRVVSRVRLAADGRSVLQVDHLRTDGSLALSDRRDVRQHGTPGGRSIVLCDADGRPVRSWQRIWKLYRAWLDALTAGEPSFLIVDSKTSANFVVGYRRPHVVTVHVLHGCHFADGERPDLGLSASRRRVVERLDGFDGVVVLSDRQRRDLGFRHVRVVPNAGTVSVGSASDRDPARGVVVAALSRRKRVEDAVRAAGAVPSVVLDVYGDGDRRGAIERLAVPGVRLHGFHPRASDAFRRASFAVLTSRSEGFPLVLVEAMAAGCIPVAYDIRYGPRDVISDGRNGLLVPAGDAGSLAAAIRRVSGLPPRRLARMRRRAIRTARRFDEERVLRRWVRALRAARRRHLRRIVSPSASRAVSRVVGRASRRSSPP